MPFVYEFKLNGKKIRDIEHGFSTSRKWEEALDEAKLSLPFTTTDEPYSMYGLLDIVIYQVDNYKDYNILDTKTFEMLIISDRVSPTGVYGKFRHDINAIEYTAKLDAYMVSSFVRSLSIVNRVQAPFITTENEDFIGQPLSSTNKVSLGLFLEPIKVKDTYFTNEPITFNKVAKGYQRIANVYDDRMTYRRCDVLLKTTAPVPINDKTVILNEGSVEWVITTPGRYEITYGARVKDMFAVSNGDYWLYKFFINVINNDEITLYDWLIKLRNVVGSYGGIESEIYHNQTRLFEIDENDAEYLKKIKAPQVFLDTATVRQVLIFLLSYVNALPRLKYGETIDILGLEQYGDIRGSFEMFDIDGISGSQNTNQIGTKSYSNLKQVMPNDLETPTIFLPSKNAYATVRSATTQLTDSNYELKLPKGKSLYKPTKFTVKIRSKFEVGGNDFIGVGDIEEDLELDLTNRLINRNEWELKKISKDYPSITTMKLYDSKLGLHENRVSNLAWQMGDTSIKLGDVFGEVFQTPLIYNVIKEALYEYYILNPKVVAPPYPDPEGRDVIFDVFTVSVVDPALTGKNYRNLEFNLEYIALEDLVIKQEKEDLSQIDFYSEMRHNQEESMLNVIRGSRKIYGDLQRVGNKQYSFTKRHFDLASIYKVGTRDINDFTITDANLTFYNDFILAEYFITKHYNRIQQATFIDQTYRWRDTYAKTVMERHEHYSDYLMLAPLNLDLMNENIEEQETLFTHVGNESRIKVFANVFSTLLASKKVRTKATVGFIKTDGMLDYYEKPYEDSDFYISVPISSFGVRQGLSFKFGFKENQIAGDSLIEKDGNYYNSPVRYTDVGGRFEKLSFIIANTMKDNTLNKQEYPLVNSANLGSYEYFSTLKKDANEHKGIGYNPLIIDKDPLTNFSLTYQVNVLSYNYNQFVIGLKFFTDSALVKESEEIPNPILYIYNNEDYYNNFEDLIIKDGYDRTISLQYPNFRQNTPAKYKEFLFGGNVSFNENDTHWAIGTSDGELLLACNEILKGFKVLEFHHRPNVFEIGKPYYYLSEMIVYNTNLVSIHQKMFEKFKNIIWITIKDEECSFSYNKVSNTITINYLDGEIEIENNGNYTLTNITFGIILGRTIKVCFKKD